MARVQFSFYRSKSKVKLSCRRTTPAPLCHCFPSQSLRQLAATWLVTGGVATAATTTNRTTSVLSSSLSLRPSTSSHFLSLRSFFIFAPTNFNCSAANTSSNICTHTHRLRREMRKRCDSYIAQMFVRQSSAAI